MNDKVKYTEAIKMTSEEIANLSDDAIKNMSYAIKYYDFGVAGIQATEEMFEAARMLRDRLQAIEEAKPQPKPVEEKTFICNGCHKEWPIRYRLNASLGAVCPDCYDKPRWSG